MTSDRPNPTPVDARPHAPDRPVGPCPIRVLDLLWEGRAPSEGVLESLLDRVEARRERGS
ncbi:hypothetical protein [Jannaschia sp. LMIT008]|uniref:hypothetical protein n=1 Tax=Jannaschia maritima TaxID=3032585 RepID=UPI0028127C6B|nr:hypothetical protein [Jannaschia sp. LMIT008]